MTLLSIIADVLWIVALSIMASSTRAAWMRLDSTTRVPLQGNWRQPRDLALLLPIVLAFVFGVAMLWGHRSQTSLTYDVIFFGLRATLAAVITMMHMQWLKGAMATLEAEGSVKS